MNDICAGIVTYNPNMSRLQENIDSIISQVGKIFLVDNGSENNNEIKETYKLNSNIVLIENKKNMGVATALNQMCKEALGRGYNWILTLDQDTVSPNNLIEKMMPYIKISNIGIVCPAVSYEGWHKLSNHLDEIDYVYACMTSASLTRLIAWKKVGGFREEYFIDFVDNEFCMKLRLNNYQILRVNTCTILHRLGESGEKKILGLVNVRYTHHSPLRFYYMIRNNRVFISEYRNHLPVMKEMCKLWYIIIKGIMCTKQKRKTIKYIFCGYMDAKRKTMGEFIVNVNGERL